MIRKPAWIAILIFILLAAVTLFLEKQGGDLSLSKTTPTPTVYKVLSHTDTDVVKATISTKDQEIVVEKDPSTGWKVVSPTSVVDGSGVFQEKLSEITALKVYQLLDPGTSDDALGVGDPTVAIFLEYVDSSSDKILIGGLTPIGSGYYARLQNGDPVVLNKNSVENILDLFTQFFATPSPSIVDTPTALQ